MPARWCGLMTAGMMADRSPVIGLTREYRQDWSFSRIICIDFDRPQWVRIPKVASHYTKFKKGEVTGGDSSKSVWESDNVF